MALRWIKSPFFRIALVLPLATGVMIGAMLLPVYNEAIRYIREEVDAIVELEILGLEEDYDEGGLTRLSERITRRINEPVDEAALYLLLDPARRRIAGNLDVWPEGLPPEANTPFRIELKDGSSLVGRVFVLSDGEQLLVGRHSPLAPFRQYMSRQLSIAGLSTALLAGLIAWFFMRNLQRRLAEMERGAKVVENGTLSHRLPARTGGDELDALAERFNHAFARIEQLMDASRHVSSAIAHDMRRPLARLRNKIEQARKQSDALPELSEQLDTLLAETDQVLRSFAALLRLARMEAGTLGASRTEVALDQLVNDVVELYEPVAGARGHVLRCHLQPLRIMGDRELLIQALINLVENALHHGDSDIEISVEHRNGQASLSVRDFGAGVPAEELPRLFERFYRVDASRKGSDHSGIGLALVAGIARYHGGQATIINARPGLCVRLDLPLQMAD